MTERYPYNDDLLITPEDQARAREEFGAVAFAFIFPDLIAQVTATDVIANRSKRWLFRRGLLSIGLVTLALLAASAAPLYHSLHGWAGPITIAAGLTGIVGGILGFLNRPDRWLEHRLVTESLRQFHFSLILNLAPLLLEAAKSGDATAFEASRRTALAAFEQNIIKRKASVLNAIIDQPFPETEAQPIPPMDAGALESPHGQLLLGAYRELRLLRQRQYADHKLTKGGGLLSKFPRAQATQLGVVALVFVGLIFLMHVGSAVLITLSRDELTGWLHYGAIWTALLALALRAVEEGLRPRAEVERYRHYQATTGRLLAAFDAGSVIEKFDAALALERAAYDEMSIFLRAYHEARFVM